MRFTLILDYTGLAYYDKNIFEKLLNFFDTSN